MSDQGRRFLLPQDWKIIKSCVDDARSGYISNDAIQMLMHYGLWDFVNGKLNEEEVYNLYMENT